MENILNRNAKQSVGIHCNFGREIGLKSLFLGIDLRKIDTPQKPFFFIHVPIAIGNKREEENRNISGRAQLIATMRVARELNKNKEMPPYSCYVLRKLCFFTTLVG